MAWKQDLAKLKQQLGPETPTPALKAQPKPAPKPSGPVGLDDEDAVFLSAMGLKPALPRSMAPVTGVPPATPVTPPPAPVSDSFQEAIKDLKGLKPLAKARPDQSPPAPSASLVVIKAPAPVPAPEAVPEEAAAPQPSLPEEPTSTPQFSIPLRFQLAAGMAIDVDGSLDLRGHSLSDAMERLKDRLGDGLVLGWRSLQVILGPDPGLHEGLMAHLASGQMPMVSRYAQAPVPMGGTQAWLLYFVPPPTQP